MDRYDTGQLRNVALVGHHGSGKTTFAEAALLASGAIGRLGSVPDGNTVSDYDPLEQSHEYSISSSLIPIEWSGTRINLIDAPGYPDFEGEVVAAAAAADGAMIAVDSVSGVEAGTELAWLRLDAAEVRPRMMLVTRLDRENANYQQVVDQLRGRFGNGVAPFGLPIMGADGIEGVYDLLEQQATRAGQVSEAPAELAGEIEAAREQLIEAAADADDDIMMKYLEGEELGHDEITAALKAGVATGAVVPVFPVCSTRDIGVRAALHEVAQLFPSPADREYPTADGTIAPDSSGGLVAFVFKTASDPFVGHLSFVRVLRGSIAAGAQLKNAHNGESERAPHVYVQRGSQQIEVPALVTGDLGVIPKLSHTHTGEVLTDGGEVPALRPLPLPTPTYRSALHPLSDKDVDKLSMALERLRDQDPTIKVEHDRDTGETILLTLGDAHASVAIDRMKQNYGVEADMTEPLVPYRETIAGASKAEYRHKKQTGGHGQYGHVVIELEPLPRGSGFEFADAVVGGSVPRQFIPAVESGVTEAMSAGPLARSPIVDLRVTLVDGSSHSVDSSEMAFKTAAIQAIREGMMNAQPVLLEPVMKMQIHVPNDNVGDVMSEISSRRGSIQGVDAANRDGYSTISAEVPLAEVQRYITSLRALVGGRGSFDMQFDRYVEVPYELQQAAVAQRAAAAE